MIMLLDIQNSGEQKVCIDLIMLRLHKYTYCVYTKESLVYTQEISCACTTLLCMLWAMEPRGQGPKEAAGPVPVYTQEIPFVYTIGVCM